MKQEDFIQASKYWRERDLKSKKLNRETLRREIEKYILSKGTCVLATAYGENVRATPLQYHYMDGIFYIFTEGGEKFDNLRYNPHVSMAIYDDYTGFSGVHGMQITATATALSYEDGEYLKVAEAKGVSVEGLKKRGALLYLLKVVPTKVEFLNSDFLTLDVDRRQVFQWDERE